MDAGVRRLAQARLKEAKNAVNALFSEVRVAFSSGDSLQGYTQDAALALRICLLIVFLMKPYEIHCGIGTGAIYVLDEEGTNASDGPAYHDALSSLERSKGEGRALAAHFGGPGDELINRLMASVQIIMERNTKKQNAYVNLMCVNLLSHPEADMKGLRKRAIEHFQEATNTSIQNVYSMLHKSKAEFIAEACHTCVRYLTDHREV